MNINTIVIIGIFVVIAIILTLVFIRKNKHESYSNTYGVWNVELVQTSPDRLVLEGGASIEAGSIIINIPNLPIIQYNIDVYNKKITSMSGKEYPIQDMSLTKMMFVDTENNTTLTFFR